MFEKGQKAKVIDGKYTPFGSSKVVTVIEEYKGDSGIPCLRFTDEKGKEHEGWSLKRFAPLTDKYEALGVEGELISYQNFRLGTIAVCDVWTADLFKIDKIEHYNRHNATYIFDKNGSSQASHNIRLATKEEITAYEAGYRSIKIYEYDKKKGIENLSKQVEREIERKIVESLRAGQGRSSWSSTPMSDKNPFYKYTYAKIIDSPIPQSIRNGTIIKIEARYLNPSGLEIIVFNDSAGIIHKWKSERFEMPDDSHTWETQLKEAVCKCNDSPYTWTGELKKETIEKMKKAGWNFNEDDTVWSKMDCFKEKEEDMRRKKFCHFCGKMAPSSNGSKDELRKWVVKVYPRYYSKHPGGWSSCFLDQYYTIFEEEKGREYEYCVCPSCDKNRWVKEKEKEMEVPTVSDEVAQGMEVVELAKEANITVEELVEITKKEVNMNQSILQKIAGVIAAPLIVAFTPPVVLSYGVYYTLEFVLSLMVHLSNYTFEKKYRGKRGKYPRMMAWMMEEDRDGDKNIGPFIGASALCFTALTVAFIVVATQTSLFSSNVEKKVEPKVEIIETITTEWR